MKTILLIVFFIAELYAQSILNSDSIEKARQDLGRHLFYNADLSINGTMACATCHEQRHAFTDNNRVHPGALDDNGKRNVPTLANVGKFKNFQNLNLKCNFLRIS
jgi:cytochrome c peroxidase